MGARGSALRPSLERTHRTTRSSAPNLTPGIVARALGASPAGIPGEPPLRDSTHQPAAGLKSHGSASSAPALSKLVPMTAWRSGPRALALAMCSRVRFGFSPVALAVLACRARANCCRIPASIPDASPPTAPCAWRWPLRAGPAIARPVQVLVNLQQLGVQLVAVVGLSAFGWRQRRAKWGAL